MSALKGWAWNLKKAKGNEMLILLLAEELADKNGGFSVSQAFIADKCNMHKRNVQKSIDRLIEKGYLIELKKGNNFTHDKTEYCIKFDVEAGGETTPGVAAKRRQIAGGETPPYNNIIYTHKIMANGETPPAMLNFENSVLGSQTKEMIAKYCDCFKAYYQSPKHPAISRANAGIFKRIVKDSGINFETLLLLVEHYFRFDNAWHKQKYHDVKTFEANLNAIYTNYLTGHKYELESKFKRFETAEERNRRADMEAQERLIREELERLEGNGGSEND